MSSVTKKTIFVYLLYTIFLVVVMLACYLSYHVFISPSVHLPIPYDLPKTMQADMELGFKPIENLNVEVPVGTSDVRYVPVFTNARGTRVTSANEPPLKVTSLVTIGASQTWGHGVLAENTFPHLLQKLLKQPVINLGVPGYNGVDAYLRLKQFWDLNPKIVVYDYGWDHMSSSLSPCAPSYAPICLHQPHLLLNHHHTASFAKPLHQNIKSISLTMRFVRENGINHPKNSLFTEFFWKYQF